MFAVACATCLATDSSIMAGMLERISAAARSQVAIAAFILASAMSTFPLKSALTSAISLAYSPDTACKTSIIDWCTRPLTYCAHAPSASVVTASLCCPFPLRMMLSLHAWAGMPQYIIDKDRREPRDGRSFHIGEGHWRCRSRSTRGGCRFSTAADGGDGGEWRSMAPSLRPLRARVTKSLRLCRKPSAITGSRRMPIDEPRIEHMIDVAAALIEALADHGFDEQERRTILSLAAIQEAKRLGQSKAAIV